MARKFACLFPLVVAMLMAGPVPAAGPPDFSGHWTLNTDKGLNLGMVKALTETVMAKQTPDKLTLDFTTTFMQDTSHRQVSYDLSSKTSVINEGPMGESAETLAKWDGNRLVVTWIAEGAVPGTKTVKTEIRTLSTNGKTMTVRSERPGKDPMELVYEKR